MGVDITMLVTIPTYKTDRLAALAREARRPAKNRSPKVGASDQAAECFLEAMGSLTGAQSGGDMIAWVAPQNRVWPAAFVEVLGEFWLSLFRTADDGHRALNGNVVVMWHAEQELEDNAIVVGYDPADAVAPLVLQEHKLPFCWTYP